MPVGLPEAPRLEAVAGIRLAAVAAGIGRRQRADLALIEAAEGSTCAATFTRNAFCAAPVTVSREHLGRAEPRYFLVNSGNANAGTGAPGLADARRSCAELARLCGCRPEQVLVFSTGVIGEPLPVEALCAGLPPLAGELSPQGWPAAARAIMTTDTVPKGHSVEWRHGGRRAVLTGIVKGAGMIRPDMATMLTFLATDAQVPAALLRECLSRAVERSFNRVSVDGDTSTNDACAMFATGCSGLAVADAQSRRGFSEALAELCERLAQAIVRDAEGATKFITVDVSGGASAEECLRVAYTVAHSPLVKTAFYASDPNWGRILAAVGRAGLEGLRIEGVDIALDEITVVAGGQRADGYREEDGQRVMAREEVAVRIALGRGEARERVWTSDLSNEYVRINAEYRT